MSRSRIVERSRLLGMAPDSFRAHFLEYLEIYISLRKQQSSGLMDTVRSYQLQLASEKIAFIIKYATFTQLRKLLSHLSRTESRANRLFQELRELDSERAMYLEAAIREAVNQKGGLTEELPTISASDRGIGPSTRSTSQNPRFTHSTPTSTPAPAAVIDRVGPGPYPPTSQKLLNEWRERRSPKLIDYDDEDSYGDCFEVANYMARVMKEDQFMGKVLYSKGSFQYPKGKQAMEAYSRGWGKKYGDDWEANLKPRFDHIIKRNSAFYFKIYKGEYEKLEKNQEYQLVELRPGMLIYTASEVGPREIPSGKENVPDKKVDAWELRHMATYYKDGMVLENYKNPLKPLRKLNYPYPHRDWQQITAWRDYDRSLGKKHSKRDDWPHSTIVKSKEGESKIGQFNVVISIRDPYYSGRNPKPKVLGPFNK